MQTCTTIDVLNNALATVRADGCRVGFVPTMGNLHEGHLALIRHARKHADYVVVSIFVNPFQFGPGEDYETYPRTLDADMEALRSLPADLVFIPEAATLYPRGLEHTTCVEVPALGNILCGASRPVFFRGVCTVVNILLNLVQPDLAVFGEKDYQQLLIIRHMVEDLHIATRIESVPTVRETDGLAISSRNRYLTADERRRAPALYRMLCELEERLSAGATDYAALVGTARARLEAESFEPDYVAIRRAADLGEPQADETALRVLAAVRLGKTRLIDNVGVGR